MKLLDSDSVVVLPWDFSDMSRAALDRAVSMVDDLSTIRVVHVAQVPSAYEYGVIWGTVTEETICQHVDESFRKSTKDDPRLKDIHLTVLFGDPGKHICEFAKDLDAGMIIIPSHGRSGLPRMFLGSVAERVVRFAPCPVLVLRKESEHPE